MNQLSRCKPFLLRLLNSPSLCVFFFFFGLLKSGKNDGSVDSHRYFTCPPSRGIFVQPDRITIGDFPPIDLLDDEEI
jgi:hypothetical protein